MSGLNSLILLLVASSMVLVYASPTDRYDKFATRLAQLLANPVNNERFNDINRFDSDEIYFPKRQQEQLEKCNRPKTEDAATQTSGEVIEPEQNNETPEDLMRLMFQSLFKLMGNMMRGVFKP